MQKDVLLPTFLNCGGYHKRLGFGSMWLSSGGTKSVIHSDGFENVLCQFSGRKRFLLWPPSHFHPPYNMETNENGWTARMFAWLHEEGEKGWA